MAAFSELLLEHFRNPRNAGELREATHQAEVTNPICGDVLRLAARIQGERIVEVRFLCRGCTTAIACASWVTQRIQGSSLDGARAVNAEIISAGFGGLPEETKHGAILAAEAVLALLRNRIGVRIDAP